MRLPLHCKKRNLMKSTINFEVFPIFVLVWVLWQETWNCNHHMFMDLFCWQIELLKLNRWYIRLAKKLDALKVFWVGINILNNRFQWLGNVYITWGYTYSHGIHIIVVARLGNSFNLMLSYLLLEQWKVSDCFSFCEKQLLKKSLK